MADEEVQEDQGNAEAKTDAAVNPEDEIDSLMSELEGQKTKPEDPGSSEDLSSLVTEKEDSAGKNIDEMLESVTDSTTSMNEASAGDEGIDVEFLQKMPLTMTLEVGRAKMSINDLLSLGQGSVLELHRLVGENLDIFANGKLIAQGEVIISNEKFGARLTHVVPPEERVIQMNGMDKSS